jgi:hypothetical protein
VDGPKQLQQEEGTSHDGDRQRRRGDGPRSQLGSLAGPDIEIDCLHRPVLRYAHLSLSRTLGLVAPL